MQNARNQSPSTGPHGSASCGDTSHRGWETTHTGQRVRAAADLPAGAGPPPAQAHAPAAASPQDGTTTTLWARECATAIAAEPVRASSPRVFSTNCFRSLAQPGDVPTPAAPPDPDTWCRSLPVVAFRRRGEQGKQNPPTPPTAPLQRAGWEESEGASGRRVQSRLLGKVTDLPHGRGDLHRSRGARSTAASRRDPG